LPPTVEEAEEIVIAVLTPQDDPIPLRRVRPLLTVMQVREADDGDRREERDDTQDNECRAKRDETIMEGDKNEHERGKRSTLIDRRHPSEDAAAFLFRR